MGVAWETFKAFLRGLFIREVNAFKRASNAEREGVERLVHDLEIKYVTTPTEDRRDAWLSAQDALSWFTSSAAERKHFFSKLAFYKEGEHTGCLLAKISHSQQTSPSIGVLMASDGKVTNSLDNIMTILL